MIIPQTHDKNHVLKSSADLGQSTLGSEIVSVVELGLDSGAEIVGNGVDRVDVCDVDGRVLDHGTVLDVDSADLRESPSGGVVIGDELGDDSKDRRGVDGLAGAEEGLVTETVGVEVTSVLVTETIEALVSSSAIGAGASSLTGGGTWVRCECAGDGVGFPNVHLIAARSVGSGTGVGVGGGWGPVADVGLARKVSWLLIYGILRVWDLPLR